MRVPQVAIDLSNFTAAELRDEMSPDEIWVYQRWYIQNNPSHRPDPDYPVPAGFTGPEMGDQYPNIDTRVDAAERLLARAAATTDQAHQGNTKYLREPTGAPSVVLLCAERLIHWARAPTTNSPEHVRDLFYGARRKPPPAGGGRGNTRRVAPRSHGCTCSASRNRSNHPTITRRPLTAICALAAAGVAVAGCGDSTTSGDASPAGAATTAPARQASAATPTTCPEIAGSSTRGFAFSSTTPEVTTIRTEPGWTCSENGGGFSGSSTPASLDGVQIPAGGSVTRSLEVKRSETRAARFALSFYSGSDRPQIMPIALTGNTMRFVEWGRREAGATKCPGYSVANGEGGVSCDVSFPTAIGGDTQATVTFDAYSWGCGKLPVEIRFALK